MKELSFDSGLVTYSLNGKCEVSFNPTDSNFVEKLYSAFEELDKKQEGYKAQIEKIADKREIFAFAKERDAEMRGIIENTFAPQFKLLFEKLDSMGSKMIPQEAMDIMEDRVDDLEKTVAIHTRQIEELKKAQ